MITGKLKQVNLLESLPYTILVEVIPEEFEVAKEIHIENNEIAIQPYDDGQNRLSFSLWKSIAYVVFFLFKSIS